MILSHYHHHAHLTLSEILTVTFCVALGFYYIVIVIKRSVDLNGGGYSAKEFRMDFFIPFRMWVIVLIACFYDED